MFISWLPFRCINLEYYIIEFATIVDTRGYFIVKSWIRCYCVTLCSEHISNLNHPRKPTSLQIKKYGVGNFNWIQYASKNFFLNLVCFEEIGFDALSFAQKDYQKLFAF
jgi:hypothetical protein